MSRCGGQWSIVEATLGDVSEVASPDRSLMGIGIATNSIVMFLLKLLLRYQEDKSRRERRRLLMVANVHSILSFNCSHSIKLVVQTR